MLWLGLGLGLGLVLVLGLGLGLGLGPTLTLTSARHSRNEEWRREEYIVDVAHLGLATVAAQKAPNLQG